MPIIARISWTIFPISSRLPCVVAKIFLRTPGKPQRAIASSPVAAPCSFKNCLKAGVGLAILFITLIMNVDALLNRRPLIVSSEIMPNMSDISTFANDVKEATRPNVLAISVAVTRPKSIVLKSCAAIRSESAPSRLKALSAAEIKSTESARVAPVSLAKGATILLISRAP